MHRLLHKSKTEWKKTGSGRSTSKLTYHKEWVHWQSPVSLSNVNKNSRLRDKPNSTLHKETRKTSARTHSPINYLTANSWTRRLMRTSWCRDLQMQSQTVTSIGTRPWWWGRRKTLGTSVNRSRLDKKERILAFKVTKSQHSDRELKVIHNRETLHNPPISTLLPILGIKTTTVLWSVVAPLPHI